MFGCCGACRTSEAGYVTGQTQASCISCMRVLWLHLRHFALTCESPVSREQARNTFYWRIGEVYQVGSDGFGMQADHTKQKQVVRCHMTLQQ